MGLSWKEIIVPTKGSGALDHSGESLALKVGSWLAGHRVVVALERVSSDRGLPVGLAVDDVAESAGETLGNWGYGRGAGRSQGCRYTTPTLNASVVISGMSV